MDPPPPAFQLSCQDDIYFIYDLHNHQQYPQSKEVLKLKILRVITITLIALSTINKVLKFRDQAMTRTCSWTTQEVDQVDHSAGGEEPDAGHLCRSDQAPGDSIKLCWG